MRVIMVGSFWIFIFYFPENQTLRTIGGIEDTIENYSAFENMNIKIDAQGNSSDNGEGWVRDER